MGVPRILSFSGVSEKSSCQILGSFVRNWQLILVDSYAYLSTFSRTSEARGLVTSQEGEEGEEGCVCGGIVGEGRMRSNPRLMIRHHR